MNLADQRVRVAIRRHGVAQQDVGPPRFEHLERFVHRTRDAHRRAALLQDHAEQIARVLIAIEHQDANAVQGRRAAIRRRRSRSGGFRGLIAGVMRQPHSKYGSSPHVIAIGCTNFSPVPLHQLTHQREPDTQAARKPGRRGIAL